MQKDSCPSDQSSELCSRLVHVSAQQKEEEEIPAGWWKIPKTNARITVGGYVKFDLIEDFNPINSPAFFDVTKIPTDGSKGTNTHLQANAAVVRFRPTTGSTENTGTFGINVSGQINFHNKDYFIYQFIAGPGIPRYRAGKYAAPDANDNLIAISGVGYTASICHYWSPNVSSVIVANYGTIKNTTAQPGSDAKEVFYGAIDVIWQFHKSAFAGIEYLYGGRRDINDADGRANRLQLSVQVDINKH